MKISLNWLSDFVDITEKDQEKMKAIVTANTAEVEEWESLGKELEHIVVGEITAIKPHPNADKLRLCTVTDGKENYPIVCGGSNLKEGQKIALAKVGATCKWHGEEEVVIKPTKIRDEESLGMICASEEIGLGELFPKKSEKEILDLSGMDLKVGTPLSEALGLDDTVVEIDNHSLTHRADLFSQYGFAREFAANGLAKWKKAEAFEMSDNNSKTPIEITIKDKEVCSRYLGVYITGVKVEDSPEWMQKRLMACGIRPISNIVDITNYVMLELGMPTHAFDLGQVKGKTWTMRKSKKGEKVITLDEQEHELFEDIIVIDDGNEIFDLCGIMGGLHSGIKDSTEKVWLHAPVYHPTMIRKARIGLGHASDASTIYEKGIDNEVAQKGLERAVQLILELCPDAQVASQTIDIKNVETKALTLPLRTSQVKRLTGIEIAEKEIESSLTALGFEIKKNKEGYDVTVPSWRTDIEFESNLVEEVARIHGYDNIPNTTPEADISPIPLNPEREHEKYIKDSLVSFGFNETYSFSFIGPELMEKTGMETDKSFIELMNPISSEISIMRQSLLPSMLESISKNLRYRNKFKLFEMARTYFKDGKDHREDINLIAATVDEDLRILQGAVEALGFKVQPGKEATKQQHPGRHADLILRGQKVGTIYELHPAIAKNFDLKARITIVEINITAIHAMNITGTAKFKDINKYPAVKLDISVGIKRKSEAGALEKAITKTDQKLITNVELVDEYTGDKIGKDERALTYSITYQATDRTLTDEEVQAVHKKVLENVEKAGGAIR